MNGVLSTAAYRRYGKIQLRVRSSNTKSKGVYVAQADDFAASFFAVLLRWRNETKFLSDPALKMAHPSYIALVKNAGRVMHLIKQELEEEPSNLIWVLEDHFDFAPYADGDDGNVSLQSKRWVAFLEENG